MNEPTQRAKIDVLQAEVAAYLNEFVAILAEDAIEIDVEIEAGAEGEFYINLAGSVFSVEEDRSVLTALEHLLRAAIRRRTGRECDLVLDLNGVVKRREADLMRFVLSAAESVCREHKRIRLNPMPPHDRKMIHMTLANFPGVRTRSEGEADTRRVVIEPDST
ncbi:hypothetical protein JW848_10955 [Candidatus Bipolaricaulota bacterium]|nr:hypothetical protein [Candidatus Bipolaricaulota bacterium]